MNLPELQFAYVIWNDAWCDATEAIAVTDAHLNHRASVHITTGWILFQDENGLSIANEYCPADQTYRGRTYIPIGMLVSVNIVKFSKPRTPKPAKVPEA